MCTFNVNLNIDNGFSEFHRSKRVHCKYAIQLKFARAIYQSGGFFCGYTFCAALTHFSFCEWELHWVFSARFKVFRMALFLHTKTECAGTAKMYVFKFPNTLFAPLLFMVCSSYSRWFQFICNASVFSLSLFLPILCFSLLMRVLNYALTFGIINACVHSCAHTQLPMIKIYHKFNACYYSIFRIGHIRLASFFRFGN